MSDQVANAIKVTVSGTYDADDVEITLATGQGAELPDPSGDNYNLPWWDDTNYPDPADDPNLEIVRVTAKAGDAITVTRAQEDTGASSKNTSAATYKMVMGVTAKTITDLISETSAVGAGLTFHMSDISTHGVDEVADAATVSAEIDSDISTHVSNGDAHHAEAHSIASHNDTTATGAELEDLTDGSDADALHAHGANDTHRTSDGSDHTYVDQSVVSGASPAFLGTNITAIPAANLEFTVIGTPTYHDAQDWFNIVQSAGIIDGFVMSNGREPTELDVSAGKGLVKITDSDLGTTVSFETSAVENVTLTADDINYIYVNYNAGTPQIVATTDRAAIELNRHFILGRVYKNGVTLHILNAGVNVPNLSRTEHERLIERDGFTHASGVIVTETGTLNLDITAGVWFMGHNRVTTDAFDSSDTDTWKYTHYGAASWITDDAAATDVDCTHYNDGSDVLASLGSNNYSSQWVYLTADSYIYIVYGTENGTLSTATDAAPPSLLPAYIETMGELIAKIIVKQSGEIISIAMVHDVKFTAVGVPNHNDLGGLQGGAANDYYHLTSAEITDLTDAGDSVAHYHANDRARANHTGTQASSTITALATARILGRKTAGAGAIEELTKADVLTLINVTENADVTGSNAPQAHEASHKASGSDEILLDELGTPTDVTTLDSSTSAHGLLKKLDNSATNFMNGQGNWAAPAGAGVATVNIWLPAEAAYLPATNPAALGEELGATTYGGFSYLAFDDTTSEHAVWRVSMPDYDGGNIIVTAYSKIASQTIVPMTLQYNILTIGLAHSEEFDAAVTVDTAINISHSLNSTTTITDIMIASATIDPANVASDDLLVIELSRDVASDDYNGDGELVGIMLEYTRA